MSPSLVCGGFGVAEEVLALGWHWAPPSPMAPVLRGAGGALGVQGSVCRGDNVASPPSQRGDVPLWWEGWDGAGGVEPSVVPPKPWGSCSPALSPSFTVGFLQPPVEPAALPVPQGD